MLKRFRETATTRTFRRAQEFCGKAKSVPPAFRTWQDSKAAPGKAGPFQGHMAFGTVGQFLPHVAEPSHVDRRRTTPPALETGKLFESLVESLEMRGTDFAEAECTVSSGMSSFLSKFPNDSPMFICAFRGHQTLGREEGADHIKVTNRLDGECPRVSPFRNRQSLTMPFGPGRGEPNVELPLFPCVHSLVQDLGVDDVQFAERDWKVDLVSSDGFDMPSGFKKSVGLARREDYPAMKCDRYHTYEPFRDQPGSGAFSAVDQIVTVVLQPWETGLELPEHSWAYQWNLAANRRSGNIIDSSIYRTEFDCLLLVNQQLSRVFPTGLKAVA